LKKTIYVIAGPTATGKSDFSIKLAKKINGVVINSDSMQVYKNLQILTARPTSSETKNIPHYMYGYIDGKERYNVDKWCNDVVGIIHQTCRNNFSPILVGGTGLYIDTLINGLIDIPPISESIKYESEKIIREFGKDFFN
jgi:tRNA delta(2)-isopentenylpyrophosphate transferase